MNMRDLSAALSEQHRIRQCWTSGLNIEKAVGNLNYEEFLNKAMYGVDTLMHIASIFYSVNLMQAAVKNISMMDIYWGMVKW